MNNLINSARVKQYALEYAAQYKHHEFTQVSKEFLENTEYFLKSWIHARVNAQPSKGKTLR